MPLSADCRERGSSATFERQWSNAMVSVDCTTLSGKIDMVDGRVLSSVQQSPPPPTGTHIKPGGYGGRGLAVPAGSTAKLLVGLHYFGGWYPGPFSHWMR
eukprot:SAG22_NODE_9101_length_610_cov_0.810176_2_plen_99_part_01